MSVVIPTYNRAGLLTRTLDSVLTQTLHDLEILLIDDGSTDETQEVVAEYEDGRLRYLRQENAGAAAARNRGLREARGAFIAFLNAGDEWLPTKLALQVERFTQVSDDVGLVYSGVEDHDGTGRVVVKTPTHRGDAYRDLLVTDVVLGGGSNVLVRRSVVAAAGLFDRQLPALEDYDYWVRTARFYAIDFIDEPVVRRHGVRDASRRSVDTSADRSARAALYERYEPEMRRLGLRHLFLVESAKCHLDEPPVDRRGARRLALRALRSSPMSTSTQWVLARSLAPSWARRVARRMRRN